MKRGVIETVLGAVILVVAGIFLFYSYNTAYTSKTGVGYVVTAKFTNIGGLRVGDNVQLAGVKIGQITNINLSDTYEAIVKMNIDNQYKLPEDSAAVVSSEGLLGGLFLSIEPGAEFEEIQPEGEILYTQPYVGLEQLLGKFIFSMTSGGDSES